MNGPAYITYFDQRYLARALVMLRSLRRADPRAMIHPLCFDRLSYEVVVGLRDPNIVPITHQEVLSYEPRLNACADRPRGAFYATHKPVLPRYVIERWPEVTRVTHIDADTHFHSAPDAIFAEAPQASILVSPHRYPPSRDWSPYYGKFNAGLISWLNDETAKACLADYREQCLNRVEPNEQDGHFMNQGYLSAWPDDYPNVHIIQHPGANLAPWNAFNHTLRNRRINGQDVVSVDEQPLIFYHFSRMFRDPDGCWRTDYLEFGENNLPTVLLKIYQPYFREVDAQMAQLKDIGVVTLQVERPDNLDDCFYLT